MNNLAFQIYGSTKSGIFQSTWNTLNTSTGSSSSNQITLPLLSGGTYNFWIDWGDGSTTNVTSYADRTHTYVSAGTYTLRATGTVGIWRFAGGGDKLKILTIKSWGNLILGTDVFSGCSNLTLSGITDVPNLSTVTSLSAAFSSCSSITTVGKMNEWNTSTITNMSLMFYQATSFNQNISNWNISFVTNISYMLAYASVFNNGYALGIANQLPWNTSLCTNMQYMFNGASSFNSNLGIGTTPWDVSKVTLFASMFNGASKFNNGDDTAPINNWSINTVSTVSMASMFNSTNVFNRLIDNWNMTKVNNTSGMFAYTRAFNQPLSNWERSGSTMANVIDMSLMFGGNIVVFNQDISTWNVSGVTNFSSMFSSTTLFNNGSNTNTNLITGRTGIDGWNINTSSFVNMSSMFAGAGGDSYVSFNRPIGNWNTSKVNNMSSMFAKSGNGNHAFNQYIGDWDTSSVTNMSYMFIASQGDGTTSQFNQDISKWNVSKVTDFSYMLAAKQFNNGSNTNVNPITLRTGIDGWDIGSSMSVVTINMDHMFFRASTFNRELNGWNTSKVTDMRYMFQAATAFNKNISSWDVSKVSIFRGMFQYSNFNNGLLSGVVGILPWTTSEATDMFAMFSYAYIFNCNIGSWNVSKVTNFVGFMETKTPSTYSAANLDAIYSGWSALPSVKPNINISFGGAKYTAAGVAGRLTLTSAPNNWTITDGGL